MATEPDPPEGGDIEDRVERLEGGVGRIERMLEQITGTGTKAHEVAEEHQEERLGRPSSIADMVARELAKADAEKAKAKDAEDAKLERQTIRETLARLTEAKPVQPQPRRQRLMWGPR